MGYRENEWAFDDTYSMNRRLLKGPLKARICVKTQELV